MTARLDDILAKDLNDRIGALLPTIELLVPAWAASTWGDEAADRDPVTPAVGLLRRISAGDDVRGDELTVAASTCLEHLAQMGEDAHDCDPAEMAAPSLALGLPGFLLAEAAQRAGEAVALPSTLHDVLHGGIPHLLSVTEDPTPLHEALGLA